MPLPHIGIQSSTSAVAISAPWFGRVEAGNFSQTRAQIHSSAVNLDFFQDASRPSPTWTQFLRVSYLCDVFIFCEARGAWIRDLTLKGTKISLSPSTYIFLSRHPRDSEERLASVSWLRQDYMPLFVHT